MRPPRPVFVMLLLLTVCFTLASYLIPRSEAWTEAKDAGFLKMALGDARRMFANHFFTKADVYFHSGYYPTIFDQAQERDSHMTNLHGHEGDDHADEEHEKGSDFLGKPQDWIDRFSRHFYPSTHSHLDKPGEAKEILPWLRLSAELDPHRVATYTVGAYWLRTNMKKPREAEAFLRQGLNENPNSFEILFELGKLYLESRHETNHAQNLLELALRRWDDQEAAGKKPDALACDEIVANLAHLEEERGNLEKALTYLELEATVSPAPEAVRKRIDEIRKKQVGKSGK
jgi:tetratricopeptide (TPR) repeat protein